MIEDTFKSIKSYLYDRNSSPLLGSFVMSWLIWNYKILFLLFSDLKYDQKIKGIEIFYQAVDKKDFLGLIPWEVSNYWSNGIVFPALTAAFYLFVFPWPSQWVYQFSLKRKHELTALRNKVENKQLLTVEDSQKIRLKLAEAERNLELKYSEDIDKKQREIDLLKAEISSRIEPVNTTDEVEGDLNSNGKQMNVQVIDTGKPLEIISQPEAYSAPYIHREIEFVSVIIMTLYEMGQCTSEQLLNKFEHKELGSHYIKKLKMEGDIFCDKENDQITLTSKGHDRATKMTAYNKFKRGFEMSSTK